MQHVRRASAPPAASFALLALACSGLAAWRLLAWRSLESPDALAYTVWGQALARGDAPPFERTTTIPKPLGALIGLVASPLPPQRAFGLAVAAATGVLVAAAFLAGRRAGGTPAAIVAAAAVAF